MIMSTMRTFSRIGADAMLLLTWRHRRIARSHIVS